MTSMHCWPCSDSPKTGKPTSSSCPVLPRRATAELATASTQVLREHAENRGPRNVVANRTSPWLFPGNRPGQHIHSPT